MAIIWSPSVTINLVETGQGGFRKFGNLGKGSGRKYGKAGYNQIIRGETFSRLYLASMLLGHKQIPNLPDRH